MAVKIEGLAVEGVRIALEYYLASLKRAYNTTKQPAFRPIIEKDMAAVQAALGSLTDLPDAVHKK